MNAMADELNESTIKIETEDGPMSAFLVVPEGISSEPAVIVLMEAFGVNSHIKDICRRLAREGYVALAPDMYHRTGDMLTYAYDDPKRREAFSAMTNEGIEADIDESLAHLGRMPEVDAGRIGTVGFCVGGFMSFLAACRTDVATAVCFYGGGIVNRREGLKLEPLLTEAANIKVPVLMLFGERDTSIPPSDVEAIRSRLAMQPREHEVVVYPGAEHGFNCDERPSFNPDAAADAWSRTILWLELRLKALQIYPTED
jgi:carboxymethylenebutenolidase